MKKISILIGGLIFVSAVLTGIIVLSIHKIEKDTSLESGIYTDAEGNEYRVNQDLSIRELLCKVSEVKDFDVVTEYISVSNIPEEGCWFSWELGDDEEVVEVDSTHGLLDYAYYEGNVLIHLDGSVADTQLVLYVKTDDFEKVLNQIPTSNEKLKVAKDFYYSVVLSDESRVEFEKSDDESNTLTFKEYFSKVYK